MIQRVKYLLRERSVRTQREVFSLVSILHLHFLNLHWRPCKTDAWHWQRCFLRLCVCVVKQAKSWSQLWHGSGDLNYLHVTSYSSHYSHPGFCWFWIIWIFLFIDRLIYLSIYLPTYLSIYVYLSIGDRRTFETFSGSSKNLFDQSCASAKVLSVCDLKQHGEPRLHLHTWRYPLLTHSLLWKSHF